MNSLHARTAMYASPRVDDYVDIGETCPELCMKYDVDIREFVILACLNDAGKTDREEIATLLGLSPSTVDSCVESLVANGLIHVSGTEPRRYKLTPDGVSLIRKAAK